MRLFPPPSSKAQAAIRKAAVLAHKEGDRNRAAEWLEKCWAEAATVQPADNDLLYFANAAYQLGVADLVSDRGFADAISCVRFEQPLLDEPESLRAEYTKYFQPKEDAPKERGGFFASLFGKKIKQSVHRAALDAEKEAASCQAYSLLNQAIEMLKIGINLPDALKLSGQATELCVQVQDMDGETDGLHFQGRIQHAMNNLDDAMRLYEQALARARYNDNKAQIARAMHEQARIFQHRDYNFIKAEECYRYGLNYYASIKDLSNLQISINALGNLAQDALSNDEFFLPTMEKEGVPVGSPASYLHIRGAVIKAEFLTHYSKYMELLLQWVEQELQRNVPLARYILREADRIATLHSDARFLAQVSELMRRISI
jgi:tetratricopeptide (TPR) repeat protein